MALKKSIPTEFGVDAEYWKIVELVDNNLFEKMKVVLFGYLNEDARGDGKSHLASTELLIDDLYIPDMDRSAIYATIKELEDWSDATDC